jgi:3-oxoacyl-[acyl-carrier-protein] synthase II
MSDSIVITGLGLTTSIGCNEDDFWESLRTGRCGASSVDCLDVADLTRKIACQIKTPIDVGKSMGSAAKSAVYAARQAAKNAGDAVSRHASHATAECHGEDPRISVIVGTTMGETDFIEDRLAGTKEDWLNDNHTRRILSGRPGTIANHVREELGIRGEAWDLYGACAAGNMAVAAAFRQLTERRCDLVIAGGSDGFSRLAFVGFMRARVMAAEVCRPFDEARDGLLVGEGAAMFVLERESDARARGARIRARVLGTAMTCESYHPTRPDPEGDGLTRSTQQAMKQADLSANEIDYVCAHGTGTPHNDAIEINVMQSCFPRGVPFSSIKALTGHPMGGAAAIEAAACVLMLEQQTLIPTWHLENPAPSGPLDPVRGSPRPAKVRCVLNNSAGFGGYNSSIILAN